MKTKIDPECFFDRPPKRTNWKSIATALIAILIIETVFLGIIIKKTNSELSKSQIVIEKSEKELYRQNLEIEKLEKNVKKLTGDYAGTFTWTTYCSACNSPRGSTATSYGYFEEYKTVACNDFALGTKLRIVVEGRSGVFTVTDRMARDGVIDFAVPTEGGECGCCTSGTCEVYVL